ncbi:hypothetical protein [Micromonospora sp. NBC_01813]|uniref:hypothetical protein n=1 Tax=Micromonospora sp. NBC_01813 TaxID=2975988 RepID=UPI002DDBB33C|nr:hypothetical protein [Micromonospora sp. NBC_01813]WSA11568.1 hypothetical protein OG958_12735 [Micromonospora sp. NBC_01813]
MSQALRVVTPVLGWRPYVLVEFEPDPDSEAGFKILLDAGGGIDSTDDAREALEITLANLPAPAEEKKEDDPSD